MLPSMIDHIGVHVSDLGASRAFYEAALGALGYEVLFEGGDEIGMGGPIPGLPGKVPDLWLIGGGRTAPVHVALWADDPGRVDAFHERGLQAGGTDNGAPGLRPAYGPGYYAAFVLDPDGNNIEAVCHLRGDDAD